MVCNLVTYRARSAVREVGVALGFPRPLVDRVAKALETYDSVMVRRDLEADGGFAEFFRRPGEGLPAESAAAARGGGARPRRRDGPAEHADAARRKGAALASAAEAGGSGRAAAVRVARTRRRSAPEAGALADAMPGRSDAPSLAEAISPPVLPMGEAGPQDRLETAGRTVGHARRTLGSTRRTRPSGGRSARNQHSGAYR